MGHMITNAAILVGVILYGLWWLHRPITMLTAHKQPSGDYIMLPVPTTRAELYRQLTQTR